MRHVKASPRNIDTKEKKTDDCRNEVSPSRFNILSAHEEEEVEIEE